MIYEVSTHNLYYQIDDNIKVFSLTIRTLELLFEALTGKLINVRGFLPLIQAEKCKIEISCMEDGEYFLPCVDLHEIKTNSVWELIEVMPECKSYFENVKIYFDENKGIILLGNEEGVKQPIIKINDNLFVGCDKQDYLQCVYIKPTKFI